MKLINNYLIKNNLFSLIGISSILSATILLTQSLKYVDLIVSYGITIADYFYVTILLLPPLLFILTPIYLFISIIYSLNKLYTKRELNILKGAGISNFNIALPILKIVLIITIMHYSLSLYWLPKVNHEFKNITNELKSNYITFFLQKKVFCQPTNYLTFYIKDKFSKNNFAQIFYQDIRNNTPTTFIAESGSLVDKNGELFLNLSKGNKQEINKDGEFSVLYFDSLMLKLNPNNNNNSKRATSLQEKSLTELLFPEGDINIKTKYKMLSEASNRIIWPFYNIILAMLAIYAILQGEYNRSGKTKRIVTFSICACVMITINFTLINLGSSFIIATYFCYIFAITAFVSLAYLLFNRNE